MSDRKELFWDEEKQQQYWIEWVETGNNDIPIKHYIGTNKVGQIEPLVRQGDSQPMKFAETDTKFIAQEKIGEHWHDMVIQETIELANKYTELCLKEFPKGGFRVIRRITTTEIIEEKC